MVSLSKNNKWVTQAWKDYELIAFGDGKKLERFGSVVTLRPEVNAMEAHNMEAQLKRFPPDFTFQAGEGQSGIWVDAKGDPQKDHEWQVNYQKISSNLKLTKFKHVGIFPEQRFNWDMIFQGLEKKNDPSFINFFGYTGIASCMARAAGAEVIHVDSVKQVIDWAAENQASSGLDGIRWIKDDAFKVAQRMVKRGTLFDFVLMDPPAFGRAGNRVWKIEEQLGQLIRYGVDMLKPGGRLVLNTYTPRVSEEEMADIAYGICNDSASIKCGQLGIEAKDGNVLRTGALLIVERGH